MACNVDGSVVKLSLHAPIHAGGTIVAHYDKNFSLPGEEGADPHEFWGHAYGPMIVYMANCGGPCDNFVPNGTVWFKVWEAGLLNGTISDDSWAMSAVSEKGAPVVMNIPKNLKAGYYLIRHELIAVHNSPSQIQFYMECAQLQVLGRGTKTPSKDYLVSFPGAYQWSGRQHQVFVGRFDADVVADPGISINFYQSRDNTTYPIPGPKVWKG